MTPPISNTEQSQNTNQVLKTHLRIVPSIDDPSKSLIFKIIERDLEVGRIIKLGRFTDKTSTKNHISFKSKVVSRAHCEIWLNHDGKILLKDTKSSSGTFINNSRVSPANTESSPVEIKDGDIVQLGINFQGGREEIYRSVKMKFEINRPEQPIPISYSMNVMNQLRHLTSLKDNNSTSCSDKSEIQVEECCICLYAIAPFQALFVSPCSHSYHYKCIRPLLDSYPGFQCPICRTYSDLDASVAIEAEEVIEKYGLRQNIQPIMNDSGLELENHLIPTNQDSNIPPIDDFINPLPVNSVISEPPLSTTLVACTTCIPGIISSPTTTNNLDLSILEREVSQESIVAGDHPTAVHSDDEQSPRNIKGIRQTNNNLVEKIKMAFLTHNKRIGKSKRRTLSSTSSNTSDEELERSETYFDLPSSSSPRNTLPILSRQSTHHLNEILEES